MAGGDEILVDEEARKIVSDLESFKVGAPDSGTAGVVSGPAPTQWAATYTFTMRRFALGAANALRGLVGQIQRDCSNALAAIDDFQRQDQEIMEMLHRLEAEVGNKASMPLPNPSGVSAPERVGTLPDTAQSDNADSSWMKK